MKLGDLSLVRCGPLRYFNKPERRRVAGHHICRSLLPQTCSVRFLGERQCFLFGRIKSWCQKKIRSLVAKHDILQWLTQTKEVH